MSLELPSVSIIVAAYEGINYLPLTIDSIFQQTSANFEILVFSDNYAQIYSWFERQPDSRLRFIVQSNLGLANTYNQGILEARGKYICFIAPGDLWHPSKLQKQIFCLDHYGEIGLVFSSSIAIDRENIYSSKTGRQSLCSWQRMGILGRKQGLMNINTFQLLGNWGRPPEILAYNQLSLSSVMLRRSCFERVGLFDPKIQIIVDWDMWIRLSHHYEFMAIAETLVYPCQFPRNQEDRWLEIETDLQIIIEKTYALLPEEEEQQKHRSYGYASLFLAENVLQHKNPDPAIAHNYLYQALQHDILTIFSAKFCRLRWVIFCLYYLQSDRYNKLLQLLQIMGDQCQNLVYTLGEYSQKIINWMLEEEDSINFWKNRKVKQQSKDL